MTQKEFDLFSKAMLFLGNACYKNCGAVPINPRVVQIDPETGDEVTPMRDLHQRADHQHFRS